MAPKNPSSWLERAGPGRTDFKKAGKNEGSRFQSTLQNPGECCHPKRCEHPAGDYVDPVIPKDQKARLTQHNLAHLDRHDHICVDPPIFCDPQSKYLLFRGQDTSLPSKSGACQMHCGYSTSAFLLRSQSTYSGTLCGVKAHQPHCSLRIFQRHRRLWIDAAITLLVPVWPRKRHAIFQQHTRYSLGC